MSPDSGGSAWHHQSRRVRNSTDIGANSMTTAAGHIGDNGAESAAALMMPGFGLLETAPEPTLLQPKSIPGRRFRYPLWLGIRSPLFLVLIDTSLAAAALALTNRLHGPMLALPFALPLWLATFGSYRRRVSRTIQSDFFSLFGAMAVPALALGEIPGDDARTVLQFLPLLVGVVLAGRLLTYAVQRAARRRTVDAEPTLIVGAGVMGCKVARALLEHPEYGMRPVGFVDGFPDDESLPLPVVADIDTFDEAVRRTGAARVIVAFGANREADLVEVLRACAEARVEVHILPRLFELGVTSGGSSFDMVWGFPLQHARRAALRTPAWRTKRLVDLVVAGAALVIMSPVLALAAVLIRLTSPGPVLFRQRRVGQRGGVVEIYKFRSMRVNGEADSRWGSRLDDRVTTVGRVLRMTSIDELPQLINVVRGDMSLVGPRPERPLFSEQFSQQVYRYKDRLRVPVGLTGWAQVHGLRGDTSIEERARFDNYYIEHWSLWFDLVILARTVGQIAREVSQHLPRPAARVELDAIPEGIDPGSQTVFVPQLPTPVLDDSLPSIPSLLAAQVGSRGPAGPHRPLRSAVMVLLRRSTRGDKVSVGPAGYPIPDAAPEDWAQAPTTG
jgi:exopolysaccharide biosynthesis polyprenyl glycosylphosphotransferase